MDKRVPRSFTQMVPLVGATGYAAVRNQRHDLAASAGLHVSRVEHLLSRYGSQVADLLAMVRADPTLANPLPGADDYLRVEVVYAVTHEGARHLDDVLARRTRISIESWDRGVAAAETVAHLMAKPLQWDAHQTEREVEHYRARVAAERASQDQPDDASADAVRLGAPEIVPLG